LKASSFLAFKYLFSKTRFSIVSIISAFSIAVLTLAYFSFFTILSVFSGLEQYSLNFSKSFDPDVKIFSDSESFFKLESEDLLFISDNIGEKSFSKIVTGNVLINHEGAITYGKILGVDDNFNNVIDFSNIISVGQYSGLRSSEAYTSYSLAEKLDLTLFNTAGAFEIYSVNSSYPDNLLVPFKNSKSLFSKGVFTTRNNDNENIIVCSLETAQSLFGLKGNMFSEIYIASDDKAKIKNILKSRFNSLLVKTHEELNETLFKMMQSEKLIVSIIMIMIVLISVFNVIGAVVMLIVEKEFDLKTFKVLGMNNKDIENIFFKNGLFINFIGLSLGLFFGISLVFTQMRFSIVRISSLELAYPVEFNLNNLLLVVFTALFVGLASSYLSSKAVRKLI
jgi:lipoprotein-releasing system permease protein